MDFEKRGRGVRIFFLFQKGLFWVRRGGWGNSTLFQRRFFLRDWDRWIFWGMGINPNGCFLASMGGRSLVEFQGRKVGFS